MSTLYVSKDLNLTPEKVFLLGDFINFCSNWLPIDEQFKVYVVDDRDHHGISTTAAYHRGDNIVKVYGKNRAVVDVLRSVAHELVHMMQDENDMLVGQIQDAGGPIEDEANAKAGEVIKRYAKSHPSRKRIYESAYRSDLLID
tara:strand:+ start:7615 stop:8043 length:429 start_codon:yes stop_codon:yes gene_type:complete